MRRLAWDHNAHHQRLLLRALPRSCGRVLEVGCGAGALAVRLAARADHVDAVDSSAAMVAAARARAPSNVRVLHDDVLALELAPGSYDAVVSLTALHHLPLEPALRHLAAALRPGGVLAVVALPAKDLPRELPVELAAAAAARLVGLALAAGRVLGWHGRRSGDPASAGMPVRDAELTVREVRRRAAEVLPGVRVRRLLFWRYSLVWHRPGAAG
ncbi:bifunctional 2-polyprenyl-6-hydroxyphenol methylase/3-demethylubiquinol 3-O-methyltransferase UbiG [Blastococcus sp. URHD0036]|uniref:class I SAM-dependent methyltransferase n=1 Tax=Blastococcus sp. URHD0036 TaxID=1380356 RepID=UPI000AD1705B|nr:class I SAM-dependent methyltransferase [Blastococcus sp. URHD0036]